ncbi:hypothetical protein CC1G_07079 [Coprinopsis cinerea okayama7|uniref:Uncharacterized protein n=1 Tax=Coprinopsis cinerea (strain Okayama-7 / 130 / ATCC MYA-4618 / FGSC 9003) TaxID=240176 RepID=A8NUD8_COPC7|nr:hypothetical protein CC1G_07079 [Coprinopsis cinerea okayama7\|eukprot:XP_001836432.2 hypothetical protein CC1G_07079 [Coprinopsis cinerea okayama7\
MSDDEDSLFGSPPPSPGRSPSPGLALPGRSISTTQHGSGSSVSIVTKNVGTIALPGSQPSSELFVNPLAPVLASYTPVPASTSITTSTTPTPAQPTDKPASQGRKSKEKEPLASAPASRPRKRKTRTVSKETTPRPEVQIPLPDPSAPLPPNFLRSQSALLGVAGLVGGVNPSQLKLRGQTSTNPIVIEDEAESSRQRPKSRPKPRAKPIQITTPVLKETINPSEIPIPTKKEILAVLVKEKDIVLILKGLMELGTGSDAHMSSTSASGPRWSGAQLQDLSERLRQGGSYVVGTPPTTGNPTKKRKLSHVPAGAADWDVPYPFHQGEGPEEYQRRWKSERGKQLIVQLVDLIKVATRKAAVQKYLKTKGIPTKKSGQSNQTSDEEYRKNGYYKCFDDPKHLTVNVGAAARFEDEPRINKYYKPITATYGLNIQGSASGSATTSRQGTPSSSSVPSSVPPSAAPVPPSTAASSPAPSSKASTPVPEHSSQEAESLDQFLSSLFAMTQTFNPTPASTQLAADGGNAGSTANTADDSLESWMRIFQQDTSQNQPSTMDTISDQQSFYSPSSTSPPTPNLGTGQGNFGSELDGMLFSAFSNVSPMESSSSGATLTQPIGAPPGFSDIPVAPDLFGMDFSLDQFVGTSIGDGSNLNGNPIVPSASPSLAPSTSSTLGDGTSMHWDPIADVFGNVHAQKTEHLVGTATQVSAHSDDSSAVSLEDWDPLAGLMVNGQGAGETTAAVETTTASTSALLQETEPVAPPSSHSPSLSPSAPPPPKAAPTCSATSSETSKATKSNIPAQKEEVVRRVKERKAQLEAELKKVKLQLWETTIEQGALNHVLQHYQEKDQANEPSYVLAPIVNTPSS